MVVRYRALNRQSWQHDQVRGFSLQHQAQVAHGNNAGFPNNERNSGSEVAGYEMEGSESSNVSRDCQVNRSRAVSEDTVLCRTVPCMYRKYQTDRRNMRIVSDVAWNKVTVAVDNIEYCHPSRHTRKDSEYRSHGQHKSGTTAWQCL